MSRAYVSVNVNETVDVPLGEVLEDIDTEDLVQELRRRNAARSESVIDGDWLDRVRWFLLHRQPEAALAMVEQALVPAQALAARMTADSGKRGTVQ